MPRRLPEPSLPLRAGDGLPFLVEHWYLGSRARRYMMVRRFREVLARADLAPGLRVLDLGCGWTYGACWARELGCRAWGVDLERDSLAWARARLDPAGGLGLAQADAKQLPFRDASFDRVISVEMLEHVFRPDRPAVLRELARVLAVGGRFALSTPNPRSPVEVAKRWVVRWPAVRRRLPSSCFPEAEDRPESYHPYRYHHPLASQELRHGLVAAGLRVAGARSFLWVPKVLPDALLGVGRGLETVAEALPGLRALGATTLVWGWKP